MEKIAQNALNLYFIVIFIMLLKNAVPLGEDIQALISLGLVLVALGVFIIEKIVHRKNTRSK
ncbi:hypothetical protein SAMN05192533_11437 [Mesobacillus persicus]|uniref:YrhC-like protein n=1 Tax=Mesobacillus persicus TaxID=930146 RepID=A0A1H8H054_9BACI|nr:hypothetical protein [Mesobacillus persicus]SEN49515.1 hypothetical protein SAMN05192533_11437 [Mesobacillus persicus]